MTRLTNAIRSDMASALLTHRFRAEGEALAQESADLFVLVYEDCYDTETQNLMAKIMKQHRDCFDFVARRCINVLGQKISIGDVTIGNNGTYYDVEIEKRAVLPNWRPAYLESPLGDRIVKFGQDLEEFNTKISSARSEVHAALDGISTVKQLQDQWPEALPIVAKLIPVDKNSLPALRFSKLTADFGLENVDEAMA